MHRNDDDRIAFTNAAYDVSNIAETRIDDTHNKNGSYPMKPAKLDEHHDHEDKH